MKLFILIVTTVLFSVLGIQRSYHTLPLGDETHFILTTQSILEDHDIYLENNYTSELSAQYGVTKLDEHTIAGRTGHQVLFHGLGLLSVLILPAFAIGGWQGIIIFMSLIYALLLVQIYTLVKTQTNSFLSFVLTAVVGLSIPLAQFSFLVFPEIPGALLVTYSLVGLARGKEQRFHYLALALLPWIHLRLIILCVLLMGFSYISFKSKKKLLFPLISLIGYFLFHYYVYGTFDPNQVYTDLNFDLRANFLQNTILAFTDKQYGLIPNAPVYLLGLAGILRLPKKLRYLSLTILLIYCYKVFSFIDWHGGYTPPARYLVVILPLLVLGIAKILGNTRVVTTGIFTVLASISVWLSVLLIEHSETWFIYKDGFHPVFEYLQLRLMTYAFEALPHFYPGGMITTNHYHSLVWYGVVIVIIYFSSKPTKKSSELE